MQRELRNKEREDSKEMMLAKMRFSHEERLLVLQLHAKHIQQQNDLFIQSLEMMSKQTMGNHQHELRMPNNAADLASFEQAPTVDQFEIQTPIPSSVAAVAHGGEGLAKRRCVCLSLSHHLAFPHARNRIRGDF